MASCAETAEPVLATSNIPIQMATESFARSQATMAVECIRVLQCYEAGGRRLREELTLKLTQKLFPCDRIPIQIRVLFLLGFFIPLHFRSSSGGAPVTRRTKPTGNKRLSFSRFAN